MPNLVTDFRTELRNSGLLGAMRLLNASVPYRYSAIFAFEGDMLRNVCLVDKDDPGVTTCGNQEITESYCLYIRQTQRLFGLNDASSDARVANHPKRESFLSYYGVPLFGDEGRLLGTACHFDTASVKPPAFVAETLDELAPMIAQAAF